MAEAPERSERRELSGYPDDFPHPYVAVDVVLLTVRGDALEVVVVHRAVEEPLGWALPGAFVAVDESVEAASHRVITDKLGFGRVPVLTSLAPFSDPDRDPRRRVVSLPAVALVDLERVDVGVPSGDQVVATARLGPATDELVLPHGQPIRLVFDHQEILASAVEELRRRVDDGDLDVHAELLPDRFTLRDLQRVHEAVIGTEVNTDSFRRRVTGTGRLVDTGTRERDVEHRPASYWTWSQS